MTNKRALLLLLLAIVPLAPASARIVSYAPVTSEFARPAVQRRDGRHFLLLETQYPFEPPPQISAPVPVTPLYNGTIVMHDARGEEEPRVLLPPRAGGYYVGLAAMQAPASGARRILLETNFDPSGAPISNRLRYLYSNDEGASWRTLPLAENERVPDFFREDVGGVLVRGRGTQIRLGNDATPFVFAAQALQQDGTRPTTLYALDANGNLKQLARFAAGSTAMLIGSDRAGERFLVIGRPVTSSGTLPNGIRILHLDGRLEDILVTDAIHPYMEGWITPSGAVYLEGQRWGQEQKISLLRNGTEETLVTAAPRQGSNPVIFAVPTVDYAGAWIVRRAAGQPTALLRHAPGGTLEEQWSDIAAPEVEAVHVARSGERLLIQVHRPRAIDNRIVIDPALAVWRLGSPPPMRYDELFLNEGPAKRFVSLDVDAVADGAPFVFDSAPVEPLPPPQISAGGGGDIAQEWGVVRASLHQRLILPMISRMEGAYGSFWKIDVIFQNSDEAPLDVELRLAHTNSEASTTRSLRLEPREIRLVVDAVATLFGLAHGGGALHITPAPGRALAVTSRTYNDSPAGTYGMGVGAVDVYAASTARFWLTFAGAFQGASNRTNLLVTDAGGRGSAFALAASGPTGTWGRPDFEMPTPAAGQTQLMDVAAWLWLSPFQPGALRFETVSGSSIASLVSIDNRSNDPTLFPPDVAAGVARTIPIIGHVDGAYGSRFRTDLFLFNPSSTIKTIRFASKPLDTNEPEKWVSFTLLPHESKIIPDVYQTVFQRTGLGRLRFQSGLQGESDGIRVTSRIYSVGDDGGTYGYVVPPLNGFQIAGPGETLEILGAVVDSRFRTNVALVDTAGQPNGMTQRVRVEIFESGGGRLDSFDAQVPNAGGIQLLDLFNARAIVRTAPTPVLIRISPAGGSIGAFATMVDNRTNDPLYLGAALAAQQ